MKKRKLLLTLPLLLLTLTACSGSENIDVKKEELTFHNMTKEYQIPDNKINTYYINDSTLEYINIKDFLNSLNGFIDYKNYNFAKVPFDTVYTVYWENAGYRFRAYFDYSKDTISINSSNVYSGIISTSNTDFTYGIEEDQTNVSIDGGGEALWELSDYFDFHYKDGNLYIPFILANTLFCSPNYYNIYFTGTEYYGFYTSIENKDSSLSLTNSEKILDKEHREANYNLIKFIMNHIYGLKDHKKINDYSTILKDYKDRLLSNDPSVFNNAYREFFMDYLDDPHTSYAYDNSYNSLSYKDYTGFKENGKYQTLIKAKKDLTDLSSSITEAITYKDDLAIIHFNEFKTGTKDQIFDSSNNVKSTAKDYDSYYYMLDCMKQIKNHSEIKNVMLDLTKSPGGNLAAMLRVIGFLTDADILLTNYKFIDKQGVTEAVKLDTNLNGNYNDNDAYTEYKWGVLASNYTYSAANLFVATVKNQSICKVYGETSGGGMCAVTPLVLADNSTIYISGTTLLATKKNKDYTFIEDGITPDVTIERNKLFDSTELKSKFIA